MIVYCEADNCQWCIDGKCNRDTININLIVNDALCEDYEEHEEEWWRKDEDELYERYERRSQVEGY